ncbi:MAG: thioredoxin family protein [Chloroflexota bacterium]
MKVELLYFDGCPSWQQGLEHLRNALQREGMDAPIELVKVVDDADAEAKRFLGSPSFRVDGADLWHEIRAQYALGCRVYHTPHGLRGVPTVEMMQEKLRALNVATT